MTIGAMEKPYKSYFGGKEGQGTLHTLINLIPPHTKYIEGFLGNGALIRNKKPASINIGIDYDSTVIDKWNCNALQPGYRFIHANFLHVCWLFESMMDLAEAFFFLDPPYLQETRKSNTRYKKEFSREDHIALLDFTAASKFKIMISCYDNPLYSEKLTGWNKLHFKSNTRRGQVTETVYYNYEISELHQYDYLGANFTERQRIKRKVNRHVQKLTALPSLERLAIVHNINLITPKVSYSHS